jgi:hypothetical protein
MTFLKDRIIIRFGAPTKITTDNVKDFSSLVMEFFSSSMELCCVIILIITHKEMEWMNLIIRTS